VDVLLTPIGLTAALLAPRSPGAAVASLAGITGLMILLSREREGRVEHQRLALRDALTGLANRALFDELLDAAWRRCARHGTEGVLLLADVDRFKAINDTHGHLAGDHALRAFALRLRRAVRSADTVARFGGDEFAVLLADPVAPDAASAVAGAIRQAMVDPLRIPDVGDLQLSASIGIATFGPDVTPVEALAAADRDLYECKRALGVELRQQQLVEASLAR
jgi:diguanylate cyclase (GGDEF)-like protein